MITTTIEDVESCITVHNDCLGFGKRPDGAFFGDAFKRHRFDVVVYIGKHRKEPWYVQRFLQPMQCAWEHALQLENEYETIPDAALVTVARRISDMVKRGRRVFIHGDGDCNGYACVLTLLAWNQLCGGATNVLASLHRDALHNNAMLCEDFPCTLELRAQLSRCIEQQRRTIEACLQRNKEKK